MSVAGWQRRWAIEWDDDGETRKAQTMRSTGPNSKNSGKSLKSAGAEEQQE